MNNLFLLGTTVTLPENVQEDTPQSTETGTGTTTTPPQGAAPQDAGTLGLVQIGLYFVVIIGVMYFMMIRPQRKRDKKMKELRESLRVGDNVLTSGGFYGKIVDVGTDVFILEFGTNKGVRIPVSKADVLAVKEPKLTPPKSESVE